MSDSGIALERRQRHRAAANNVSANPGGIELSGSSDSLIEDNLAGATTGTGIWLGDGALRNRVLRNRALGTGAEGVVVAAEAEPGAGNLLQSNTVAGNAATGSSWPRAATR